HILEYMPSPLTEVAGGAHRAELHGQPDIAPLPSAETEFGLVDLDLRLAVDGDEELLPRLALADLARRFCMQGHPRSRGGGVCGQGALDHDASLQAGPLGEAANEVPVVPGELHARCFLRRRGSRLGTPAQRL